MRILIGPKRRIEALVFSPNGRFLAAHGDPSKTEFNTHVWDIHESPKPKHALLIDALQIVTPFTSDSLRIQCIVGGKAVNLNLADGTTEPAERKAALPPSVVSPDSRWTVISEDDQENGIVRLRGVELVGEQKLDRWSSEVHYSRDRRELERLTQLRFIPDSSHLLVIFSRLGYFSPGIILRALDTATGGELLNWNDRVPKLIGPYGQLVFLEQRSLRVREPMKPSKATVMRTSESTKHFTAAAFSPDGKLLATTSNDTTVTLWDTATWQPIQQYAWEIGRLRAVAFAPDGLTCAAGSDTGKVVLFDVDG